MIKHIRFFGKAWTVEYRGNVAYVTDAHSAATVEVQCGLKDWSGVLVSSLRRWTNVPPYIRRLVDRHVHVTDSRLRRQSQQARPSGLDPRTELAAEGCTRSHAARLDSGR
jgi:hypothetical protein